MSRKSLLGRLIGSARPESKSVRRSRLAVEALEDRTVPAVFTVNSTADDTTANDGLMTLREAILAANNTPQEADTIQFSVTGPTVTLGGKLPELSSDITITGPGAKLLAISGAGSYRIFAINSSVTATISGLTLSHGYDSGNGGGIYNQGTLRLTDCALSGNTAGDSGGGIYNSGTLKLTDCTISSNT